MANAQIIAVRLTPKASANRVGDTRKLPNGDEQLVVYVTAPPEDGKANESKQTGEDRMKSEKIMQEDRTARLTILIDPNKKKAFEDLCARLDTTPSQALRQMIRDFLTKNNVTWTPGDAGVDDKK